jgi:leucyl-tRNA synthetase
MEYSNWVGDNREAFTAEQRTEALRTLTLLLAPIVPFMAEELWERLGGGYSVHEQAWPTYDPAKIVDETVTLIVQVNGKVRDKIEAPVGTTRLPRATSPPPAPASPPSSPARNRRRSSTCQASC